MTVWNFISCFFGIFFGHRLSKREKVLEMFFVGIEIGSFSEKFAADFHLNVHILKMSSIVKRQEKFLEFLSRNLGLLM